MVHSLGYEEPAIHSRQTRWLSTLIAMKMVSSHQEIHPKGKEKGAYIPIYTRRDGIFGSIAVHIDINAGTP